MMGKKKIGIEWNEKTMKMEKMEMEKRGKMRTEEANIGTGNQGWNGKQRKIGERKDTMKRRNGKTRNWERVWGNDSRLVWRLFDSHSVHSVGVPFLLLRCVSRLQREKTIQMKGSK